MKNLRIIYLIIFLAFLLVQCKVQKTSEKLISINIQPTIKELNRKYYGYHLDHKKEFYEYRNDDRKQRIFKPAIYTNIAESNLISGFPKGFFRLSFPNKEDIQYFVEKMNGEYVLYMEKDGRITMREYAKYYNYSNDSIKNKLNTEKKIYDYLKNNYIKYKIISKHSDGYYKTRIKLLLGVNQYYTYITFGYDFIVTNMYYNAKDTLYLNNNFGRKLFRR